MFKKIAQGASLANWYFRVRCLGKREPLVSVLFVSDKCNLKCRHCNIHRTEKDCATKTTAQIEDELKRCRKQGSLFVDFEGGEPFLWRDGDKTIDDLCVLAKKIGFISTTITTNAQIPFDAPHNDLIWVSLDGVGAYHDAVRGDGAFARLEKNVAASNCPNLNANMAINRLNYESVEDVVRYVADSPKFNLLSVNFHTPFPGTESMELDWETRLKILDRLIELKKKGAPLMNTTRGLRGLRDLKFKKRCWMANFIGPDGTFLPQCAGESCGICDRCGFGMSSEMAAVYALAPETIAAGLKTRVKKH